MAAGHLSPALFETLRTELERRQPPAAAPTPAAAPAVTPASAEPETALPSLLSLFEAAVPTAVLPPAPAGPAAAAPENSPMPVAAVAPATATVPGTLPSALPAAAAPKLQPAVAPPIRPAAPATSKPVPSSSAASATILHKPELTPAAVPPGRSALSGVLAAVFGLGLMLLVAYLVFRPAQPDEQLTVADAPGTEAAASEPVAAPTAPSPASSAPVAYPPPRDSAAAPANAPGASDELPAPAPTTDAADSAAAGPVPEPMPAPASTSSTAEAPVPAAPEANDPEAALAVRQTLARYYADLFAPPLKEAATYFAPHVERLYIQQNLTPAAIAADLGRSFFPDNRRAVYQVEPGTLAVSAPNAAGEHTATYLESCRLFRVSRGRYQRLRTQVRARFDADNRIVYLRQEKLISSEFE